MAIKKVARRHAIYRFRKAFKTEAEARKYAALIGKSKTRVFKDPNQLVWSAWIVDEIVGYE